MNRGRQVHGDEAIVRQWLGLSEKDPGRPGMCSLDRKTTLDSPVKYGLEKTLSHIGFGFKFSLMFLIHKTSSQDIQVKSGGL